MKKSVVSVAVTTMFVVYSLYQRAFGVQASSGAAPTLGVGNRASGPLQDPSGSATAAPIPSSTPVPAQSNPTPAVSPSAPTALPTVPPTPIPTQSSPTPMVPPSTPTALPTVPPTPTRAPNSLFKDGTYTGSSADAYYGTVQVQAIIANGKLANIKFLQWPNDRSRSVRINQQALPWLTQEAIQVQSYQVDVISGATDSSYAFAESLKSALGKAES